MKAGDMVKTVVMLETADGILVVKKHLDARRANCKGRLLNWVPGHGGDVWFVQHESDDIAAYSITEFAILD